MMEIKKIKNKIKIGLILISLIILFYIGGASAGSDTVYRSYIDQDYGFYRVIVLKDNVTNISYINKTLNINVGDTLIWMNDATPDEELSIVSEQGLWNGTARLRWNYQIFNYTFNNPGIYTFHIKEYPRLRQTVIVENNITGITPNTPNITQIPVTIIPTVNITAVNETAIINETITPGKKSPGFDIIIVIVIILFVYKGKKKLRMGRD